MSDQRRHSAVRAALVCAATVVSAIGCDQPESGRDLGVSGTSGLLHATTKAYTRAFGGEGWSSVLGVSGGPDGSLVVTGAFTGSVDFDPGPDVDEHLSQGGSDVFVTRFAADGSYAGTKTFGGPQDDVGTAAVAMPDGSLVVIGAFRGAINLGSEQHPDWRAAAGAEDGFAVHLVEGGLSWAVTWGGPDSDWPSAAAAAPDGGLIVTGVFGEGSDLDPGPGDDVRDAEGAEDVFVLALDRHGRQTWARSFGGSGHDFGTGVAVAADGSILVSGYFEDTVAFEPEAPRVSCTAAGASDAFVSKLTSDGAHLWTRCIGGASADYGNAVTIGSDGAAYLAGAFAGAVAFAANGRDVRTSAGDLDAFVTRLGDDGSSLWTATWGGAGQDEALGVAAPASAVVVAGHITSVLDDGADSLRQTATATTLAADGTRRSQRDFAATGDSFADSAAVLSDGAVAVAGSYRGALQTGGASLPAGAGVGAWVSRFVP